jgi:MFS family permease
MRGRLGVLAERNFRLVFTSTTISAVGDGVALIALVFAVLEISGNSATSVGIVLACREVAAIAITLAAGVISDRFRRHVVLVGVAALQAVVQASAGLLIVTGNATVALLAGLAAVYGLADGFVLPASQGLIPAVVSSSRLQQANALLGLSRSILGFAAPAIGGLLVATGSPGSAILIDAASFAIATVLLLRLAIPKRDDSVRPEPFFQELREGWGEFKRHRWIWTTVVFFAIGNFASEGWPVLAPLVMKEYYNGAATYGLVLSMFGVGTVLGGLVALRWRPPRPLLASCAAAAPLCLGQYMLAFPVPLPLLIATQVIAGIGLSLHLAFWFTVLQQQVPEHVRARVSSYDALGSFTLVPIGTAIAGPLSSLIGVKTTLLLGASTMLAMNLIVIAQPSVRAIRRDDPEPSLAPA